MAGLAGVLLVLLVLSPASLADILFAETAGITFNQWAMDMVGGQPMTPTDLNWCSVSFNTVHW